MELISIAEARARVLAVVRPLAAEEVPLERALGRVLAEDVAAAHDVPPFRNSAMDGHAVRSGPAGRRLRIVGESRAGAPARMAVSEGEAIAISTGAAVPDGGQAVIPIELSSEHDGELLLGAAVDPDANIREAGEDMRAGAPVLSAGTALGPAELAALVGAGRAAVTCARRPLLEAIGTGDELVAPGAPLGPGQIHDSNAIALAAFAARTGAVVVARSHAPDRFDATEAVLATALERADVVVVAGGVSVGAHDHVKDALAALGVAEHFWGVTLKPGKPTWFGTRGERLVFGLPGNPVSAVVTFALFVAPALRALQGERGARGLGEAIAAEPIERAPQREQAVRVRLDRRADGLFATPTGPQGSHVSSSLLGADALAMVPAGSDPLPVGARVALERLWPCA